MLIASLLLAAGTLANANVDLRVKALLARMTLDEKIGQMVQVAAGPSNLAESQDASKRKTAQEFLDRIKRGEIGSLIGACGIENFNRCQRAALSSRNGIPLMAGHDLIHGCITALPIPLGLACTWNEDLWERSGDLIGREGLLKGCNWTFAPMVDIARDARWGRIAEGPGQDPYLASLYAAALVKGIQGKVGDGTHIAACLKHYVAYGAPSGGRDYNEVEMADSTLRDIYLPPFAAGIKAGALTVMPGFHAYNGVPCSVNEYLLQQVLRQELNFKGFTISDWGAVGECSEIGHSVTEGEVDTASAAVRAGVDQEMMRGFYVRGLKTAVTNGLLPMAAIDAAVGNVLRVKFKMGLFEHPFIDGKAVSNNVDFAVHRAFARTMAQKSCVLLKNADSILPLSPKVKVALVGDIAANEREMRGTWQPYWENVKLASLKAAFEARGVDFVYERGYSLDRDCNRSALKAAITNADVVVAAFGEYSGRAPIMSGENTSRARLELPQCQLDALAEIRASGKPLVAVLFSGRPLPIVELAKDAQAILLAWHPGSCGGAAIADLLYGDAEPYGRLTVDFPRATGQCPIYYNRTSTGRPNKKGVWFTTHYTDCEHSPLYPFGFGLTYSKFAYADEQVKVSDGQVTVSATVKNVGMRQSSEVVQVYLRDCIAPVVRPERELKGFKRLELAPGESCQVAIAIPIKDLGYHLNGKWMAAEGRFTAWIAPDSLSGKPLAFTLP